MNSDQIKKAIEEMKQALVEIHPSPPNQPQTRTVGTNTLPYWVPFIPYIDARTGENNFTPPPRIQMMRPPMSYDAFNIWNSNGYNADPACSAGFMSEEQFQLMMHNQMTHQQIMNQFSKK